MTEKISCLCVSHPSRYGLLQRAVYNFLEQTYENKELVILVADGNYHALLLGWLRDSRHPPEISAALKSSVLLRRTSDADMASMASYGMAMCLGDYIAVWDDDNLSHPTRLASQLEHSREYPSVFSKSFYYFYDSEELYVADYAQPGGSAVDRCCASSLMFNRHMFPPKAAAVRGAPRGLWYKDMIELFASSFPEQQYTHIQDIALCLLFMQCSNGDNFRGQQYHRQQGSSLPATWTREQILGQTALIESMLQGYRFSGRPTIDVAGKDAAACSVTEIKGWPTWFLTEMPPESWAARIPETAEWNEAKAADQTKDSTTE